MANNFERRRCRSDFYQEKFFECAVSADMMESFPNSDSISNRLSGGFSYDETILELEDQLKEEFWRIVDEELTERQREVIRLSAEGLTQMEIAKMLGVNQSSVTKSLYGNKSYVFGKPHTTYGGSKKRVAKIIQGDEKIMEILRKIAERRENEW